MSNLDLSPLEAAKVAAFGMDVPERVDRVGEITARLNHAAEWHDQEPPLDREFAVGYSTLEPNGLRIVARIRRDVDVLTAAAILVDMQNIVNESNAGRRVGPVGTEQQ